MNCFDGLISQTPFAGAAWTFYKREPQPVDFGLGWLIRKAGWEKKTSPLGEPSWTLSVCGRPGVSDTSSFLHCAADRHGLAVRGLRLQADAFHPEGVGRDHCPQPVRPQRRPVCPIPLLRHTLHTQAAAATIFFLLPFFMFCFSFYFMILLWQWFSTGGISRPIIFSFS